jgi:2-polyprenyl-3-methyl-5-hydroxy-6-metoxy-1,4-benzoquinol methylase
MTQQPMNTLRRHPMQVVQRQLVVGPLQRWLGAGLEHRDRQDEWMDEPDLDARLHHAALSGLARLNWLSGSTRILAAPVWQLARQQRLARPRILDLASGGGDLTVKHGRSGRRRGFDPQIVGWDKSPLAVEHARGLAARCRAAVQFECVDLFARPWSEVAKARDEPFDVVLCSLFLHHLDEPQAIELLEGMARLARHLVLVNDIVRGWANHLLVALGARLVTRSPVVHVDAVRSIRAAFTRREAAELADRAGLAGACVESRWPCRLLLTWSKPQ